MEKIYVSAYSDHLQVLTTFLLKKFYIIYIISRKDKIRNNIIKQKMNIARSLLDDIKTQQPKGMDMFREWKRGDYQNSYEMEPTRKKKTRLT